MKLITSSSNTYNQFYITFLLLICLLAIFSRLWGLDQIPPGFQEDEAFYAHVSEQILAEHNFRAVYGIAWEGMIFWEQALSFSLFGPNVHSARLVGAINGLATIIAIYLLTLEIHGKKHAGKNIALLASFLLTASFWHLMFSRTGFRLTPMVAVDAFLILFTIRMIRTTYKKNAIIAGFLLGLGCYTYPIHIPIALLAVCVAVWAYVKGALPRQALIIFILTACIISIPYGVYINAHIGDYITAYQANNYGMHKVTQLKGIESIWYTFWLQICALFWQGDYRPRHNIFERPQLEIITQIGLVIIFLNWIKMVAFYRKRAIEGKQDNFLSANSWKLLLVAWAFLALIVTSTATSGAHALRSLGAIVPLYILAAQGLYQLWLGLRRRISLFRQTNVKWAIPLILLLIQGTYNFYEYFYRWSQLPQTYIAYHTISFQHALILKDIPRSYRKILVVKPQWKLPYLTEEGRMQNMGPWAWNWAVQLMFLENIFTKEQWQRAGYEFVTAAQLLERLASCHQDCAVSFYPLLSGTPASQALNTSIEIKYY